MSRLILRSGDWDLEKLNSWSDHYRIRHTNCKNTKPYTEGSVVVDSACKNKMAISARYVNYEMSGNYECSFCDVPPPEGIITFGKLFDTDFGPLIAEFYGAFGGK